MIVLNWIILLIEKLCYLKDLDNGLFEPYVLKGTRTVLRRVRGSNASILSDKWVRMVLKKRGVIIQSYLTPDGL